MSKERRHFTEEFKAEVVALCLQGDRKPSICLRWRPMGCAVLAAGLVVLMGTVAQAASGKVDHSGMSLLQLEDAARHGNARAMVHLGKR
ncbi:MAG: transposase [Candidatus Sericytochromatia bacterium]|nr:transposase [Candidatus Sericytochromatia bacterium]